MMKRTFAFALLAIAATAAPAFADEARVPPSLTVTGEGSVSATPDIAIVSSGVVTQAQTAAAALKANAAAMTKVLAAVKQAGIEERDVATSGIGVQPQYDYGNDSSNPRSPRLVGYEVRNVVTIRSRNVDRAGDLVDGLVQAGSNQIEGLSFDVSDRNEKLDEARRDAVADARRKAELYATAAGVKLGAPLSIEETGGLEEPVRPFAMRAKAMDAAAATPIAKGEQELRARVVVRWKLEN